MKGIKIIIYNFIKYVSQDKNKKKLLLLLLLESKHVEH